MKSALHLESEEPIYGDYPALYALGIVTPVASATAASLRRTRGRGFALIAFLGAAAIAVTAVVAWYL